MECQVVSQNHQGNYGHKRRVEHTLSNERLQLNNIFKDLEHW